MSGNAATVTTNANLTGAVTSAGNATTLSNAVVTSAKLSADLQAATYGMKNRIINGNFGINQRGVSGTVVLAAGVYGHDRFKAGASGCTYTFATSANVTTLTISAGSLVQVVEGLNLQSGTYTLSWTGTAQGKINGGSYAGSGLTGTATGGTNLTVEFSTGSLSFAQLEKGSTATSFDFRDYGRELIMCQRYFHQQDGLLYLQIGSFLWDGQVNCSFNYQLPVTMRSVPTFAKSGNFTSTSYGSPNVAGMTIDASASTTKTVSLVCITGTGGTAGYSTYIRSVADTSALFSFSAEL